MWKSIEARSRALQLRLAPSTYNYSTRTDLGILLRDIARLPQELVDIVMTHLSDSGVGSIFRAQRTIQDLLPTLSLRAVVPSVDPQLTYLSWFHAGAITKLSARQVSILGQKYISELAFGTKAGATHIDVAAGQAIWGLQYAVSRFGLRAVRILYRHMDPSPWLGDESHSWMGTVYGTDLRDLHVSFDELRVISPHLEGRVTTENRFKKPGKAEAVSQVLWDRDMSWLHHPRHRRNHNNDRVHTYAARMCPRNLHYQPWRLCHYLPLVHNERYIRGLTIYYTDKGIQGYRMHIALCTGEYLTSLWMITPDLDYVDRYREALATHNYLTVTTSHQKTKYFGDFFLIVASWEDTLNWTRVTSERPCKITGFVLDARTHNGTNYCEVGVTEEAVLPGNDGVQDPWIAQYPRFEVDNARLSFYARHTPYSTRCSFMSTTSLMDVARIDLQLRASDERPFGMQVTHCDETIDILGEWDPTQSFTTLYTTTGGPLAQVIFTLTKTSVLDHIPHILGRITSVAVTHDEHSLENQNGGPMVVFRADNGLVAPTVLKAGGKDRVVALQCLTTGEPDYDTWYHYFWCYDSDPTTGPPPFQGGPKNLEVLV